MRKVLALILVFVSVSVKDLNATTTPSTTVDRLVWTAGSAVNVTIGPEDAVYCMLKDNRGRIVFDGFGPCRVVLDRVTKKHTGYWELLVGAPGTVIVRSTWIDVEVAAAVDFSPVVRTSVRVTPESTVRLFCSVPGRYQVQSCTFRNPSGGVLIAMRGRIEEAYENDAKPSYESYADDSSCQLDLLTPSLEHEGIWRCAVVTTLGISYGFLDVTKGTIFPNEPTWNTVPALESRYHGISSTEGDPVTMSCYIGAPVRYCYFRSPNGTVFNVGPSTSSADYEYVGNGFDAGECGIRFNNIWTSAQGQWSCNVGLNSTAYYHEKRDFFNVYVNERVMVYHRWEGSTVVVRMRIAKGPELEYCRFVRSDGLGFASEHVTYPYDFDLSQMHGTCTLYIWSPIAEDLRPWTVVAKISGEDEEVSVTTRMEPRSNSMGGMSRSASTFLWCLFGSIFVFLIVASFMPKRNRDWTRQRAARIRDSFRRQPQPQPTVQNVTNLPNPVHTDILTDLPRKV